MNRVAYDNNKPVFKQHVSCPDVFNTNQFFDCMKSIFGSDLVVTLLID